MKIARPNLMLSLGGGVEALKPAALSSNLMFIVTLGAGIAAAIPPISRSPTPAAELIEASGLPPSLVPHMGPHRFARPTSTTIDRGSRS